MNFLRGAVLAAAILSLLPCAARAQGAIEAWVQLFDGPGNGDDSASAVALDASGNVVVAGDSGTGGGFPD